MQFIVQKISCTTCKRQHPSCEGTHRSWRIRRRVAQPIADCRVLRAAEWSASPFEISIDGLPPITQECRSLLSRARSLLEVSSRLNVASVHIGISIAATVLVGQVNKCNISSAVSQSQEERAGLAACEEVFLRPTL